jgi:hypothetical protein
MKSTRSRTLRQLFLLASLLMLIASLGSVAANSGDSLGAMCTVPSWVHSSIQQAIDDPACTAIELASLRYQENLVISRALSIQGAGVTETTIDGQFLDHVVYVQTGAVVTLSNLAITQGQSSHGGGIYNEGRVDLKNVYLHSNQVSIDGGGLFNRGVAVIYDSAVIQNRSTDFSGGGLRNEGEMYVNNSIIARNSARFSGGGISNEDEGRLRVHSSTIAGNQGGAGGGIAGNEHGGGQVVIKNSLLAGNRTADGNAPSDCMRQIISDGYNLIEKTTGCFVTARTGDLLGIPANLGPVVEGPPPYYPLTALSPAVDAGDPAGCTDHLGTPLTADQRGTPRQGRCDIGAIEFEGLYGRVYLPAIMHVGCPDFFDDFSNPSSGWPIEEDEFVAGGYVSGEYRILSKNPQYMYLYLAPACPRRHYAVEFDARWQGTPGGSYGLLFGASADLERFYLFEMNSDYQLYRVINVGQDGVSVIAPVAESRFINKGNAPNKLKVTWQNGRISAFVNNQLLGSWTAVSAPGNAYVGLAAGSYSDQNLSDARFDNFSVVTQEGAVGAQREADAEPTQKAQVISINALARLEAD